MFALIHRSVLRPFLGACLALVLCLSLSLGKKARGRLG